MFCVTFILEHWRTLLAWCLCISFWYAFCDMYCFRILVHNSRQTLSLSIQLTTYNWHTVNAEILACRKFGDSVRNRLHKNIGKFLIWRLGRANLNYVIRSTLRTCASNPRAWYITTMPHVQRVPVPGKKMEETDFQVASVVRGYDRLAKRHDTNIIRN